MGTDDRRKKDRWFWHVDCTFPTFVSTYVTTFISKCVPFIDVGIHTSQKGRYDVLSTTTLDWPDRVKCTQREEIGNRTIRVPIPQACIAPKKNNNDPHIEPHELSEPEDINNWPTNPTNHKSHPPPVKVIIVIPTNLNPVQWIFSDEACASSPTRMIRRPRGGS